MARPRKQTVDYFPHVCVHNSKTMFVIEQRYGNDGYAFWFKLLELLGSTDGHYLTLDTEAEWAFLQAKTRLTRQTSEEILGLLADLDALDTELWTHGIVWSQHFVDGVSDAYRNRASEIPKREDILRKIPHPTPQPDTEKPQTILYETKGDDKEIIIVDNSTMTPYQTIVGLFHKLCPSFPRLRTISDSRKRAIKSAWKRHGDLAIFEELFCKAEASDFLSGRRQTDQAWRCSFDWLLKPANTPKVLEGNYDNGRGSGAQSRRSGIAPTDTDWATDKL